MTEYQYFSKKLSFTESVSFLIKKEQTPLSLNPEENSTLFVSKNILNTIESNNSLIVNQTRNKSNLIEEIDILNSEKSSIFGLNNNNYDSIDFHKEEHLTNKFIILPSNGLDISLINQKQKDDESPGDKHPNKKRNNTFKIVYPKEFYIFNKLGEKRDKKFLKDLFIKKLENSNKKIFHKRGIILRKRKYNSDNIRKKIKTRFIHSLKENINQKLKIAGSTKFFELLPQNFTSNISKDINRVMFDKSFKEVYSINFCKNENKNDANLKKFQKNLDVLEYLEKNKEISEKSYYDYYKNLKFYQIYDEYIRSKEFKKGIITLKLKGEKEEYIYNYIKLAYDLNNFFYK